MSEEPKRKGWFTELRRQIDGPLLWFGVVVGAMSGISAIARVWNVGLVGVFQDFVNFYRALLSPLYELVNLPPWPFHVPELAVDLLAVYAVMFGMSLRALTLRVLPGVAEIEIPDGVVKVLKLIDYRDLPISVRLTNISWALTLLPVLTFLPIIQLAQRWRRAEGRLENYSYWTPEGQPISKPLGWISDGWLVDTENALKGRLIHGVFAFLALPAAIIIFFLLNAYVPAPQ